MWWVLTLPWRGQWQDQAWQRNQKPIQTAVQSWWWPGVLSSLKSRLWRLFWLCRAQRAMSFLPNEKREAQHMPATLFHWPIHCFDMIWFDLIWQCTWVYRMFHHVSPCFTGQSCQSRLSVGPSIEICAKWWVIWQQPEELREQLEMSEMCFFSRQTWRIRLVIDVADKHDKSENWYVLAYYVKPQIVCALHCQFVAWILRLDWCLLRRHTLWLKPPGAWEWKRPTAKGGISHEIWYDIAFIMLNTTCY